MPEGSVTPSDDDADRDQQLEAVIADYIRAGETGRAPDRREILERHPELADELRQFFDQRDRMNQMAEPIRGFGDALSLAVGPGQQLNYVGNYELLEEIARGGMGVVYKARQTTLGRIVAVKMIVSGRLATEQDVQRFQVEAEAAAGLQHPNIVSIHEVGQHEGFHYFSMDYVEGRDLSAILRENLLPAKQAATYVRQMAEAIHYAHQQGTLHRDLKPSNILIDSHDQVRITDFGLAMRVEGNSDLTRTGQIVGTPSYMPPEQARGQRSLIGPGSDVYGLGAILYECLTGRAPFRADSVMKTIEQVIHVEAASPRLLNPGIARDLETICLKCLEKEPHRRYGTAQLLADDLGRFLRDEPIVARRTSALDRVVKWTRRKPTSAALVGVSGMAVFVIIVGLLVNNRMIAKQQALTQSALDRENAANNSLESANQTLGLEQSRTLEALGKEKKAKEKEEEHRRRVVKLLDDAKISLYAERLAQAEREVVANNSDRAKFVLETCETDHRHWEWHHLTRRNSQQSEPLLLDGFQGFVYNVAFSSDGKLVAAACGGWWDKIDVPGGVKVWEIATGKELFGFEGLDIFFSVAFSADGKHLAAGGARKEQRGARVVIAKGGFKMWNLATGREELSVDSRRVYSLAFTPDAKRLAVLSHSQVGFYDVESHQEVNRVGGATDAYRIAFNREGSHLAIGSSIRDLVRGTQTSPKDHTRYVYGVAFSPDGIRLATSCAGAHRMPVGGVKPVDVTSGGAVPGDVKIWDTTTSAELLTLRGHISDVFCITFSPDGKRIATAGGVWDRGLETTAAGNPDGPADVKFWDATSGREVFTLRGHKGAVYCVAFDPSGKVVATGGRDNALKIWRSE